MGKTEAWEVAGRTDEAITFLFKRRIYNEEKLSENKEDVSQMSSRRDEDGFDEETRAVLKKLDELNMRIRKKYQFDIRNSKNIAVERDEEEAGSESKTTSSKKKKKEKKKEKKPKQDKKKSRSARKPEDLKSVKDESTDTERDNVKDHVVVNGVLVKKGKAGEPCDHLGVPLSHPMAMTPYPGASTAAQREKARKMLKEIAKQMHDDELKKEKKGMDSKTESSKTKKSTTAESSTKSSRKSSTKSKSKNSKSSNKKMGCDKCGSCQKCIHRCSQKHAAEQKVTDEEREEFLKAMKCLRKRIVKPERSRERAVKSPYDITQSGSDTDLSTSKSRSKKISQEK